MTFLPILPAQSGYSSGSRAASTMYRVAGGRPRGRLDMDEPAHPVTCTWRLRAGLYGQLMAFYRAQTEGPSGPQPFEADLVLDTAELLRYQAQFVPGSMALGSIDGGTYTVTAELEAEPMPGQLPDAAYDEALVAVVEAFGMGDAKASLADLTKLVNEDLRT